MDIDSDFTAWSLYTGPSYLELIIDDPDCPWIVGQWDGVNPDTSPPVIKADLDQRIQLVVSTFARARGPWRGRHRHFAIPEFFFHCRQGPYPDVHVDGALAPFDYLVRELAQKLQAVIPTDNNVYCVVLGSMLTSNVADYAAFLASPAVIERQRQLNAILPRAVSREPRPVGRRHTPWRRTPTPGGHTGRPRPPSDALATLNNFMTVARGNPLCTVRNRGAFLVFDRAATSTPAVYVYEKQYESTVDLTMGMFDDHGQLTPAGMITEWVASYPSYSILDGDKQTTQPSNAARFTPPGVAGRDFGVEICLDHRMQRLRRTVDMCIATGAAADNFPLSRQFIPSGGMQILDFCIAAASDAVIFNADGLDQIYYVYADPSSFILHGESGTLTSITNGVYTKSVQAKWTGRDGHPYYSHSQLAFTTPDSAIAGFNNALDRNNVKAKTYDGSTTQPSNPVTDAFAQQITPLAVETPLFACSTGQLDQYSTAKVAVPPR
jgi:hypothetical protein